MGKVYVKIFMRERERESREREYYENKVSDSFFHFQINKFGVAIKQSQRRRKKFRWKKISQKLQVFQDAYYYCIG